MYLLDVMGVQSLKFLKYQMSSDVNFAFYVPKFDSGRLFLLFTRFKGFRIRDIYDQSAIWAGWRGWGELLVPQPFFLLGPFKTSHVRLFWEILSFSISS